MIIGNSNAIQIKPFGDVHFLARVSNHQLYGSNFVEPKRVKSLDGASVNLLFLLLFT